MRDLIYQKFILGTGDSLDYALQNNLGGVIFFTRDIQSKEQFQKLIKDISKLRNEPDWLLQWRLSAFEKWQKMTEPHWAEIDYEPIDYDSLNYYNKTQKIDNSELKENPSILTPKGLLK